MLKYAVLALLLVLPFSVSAPEADAGLFRNRPVRTFFQNRRPVRKFLRISVVEPVQAVRSYRASNCQCTDCQCGSPQVSSSDCVNCGTEE